MRLEFALVAAMVIEGATAVAQDQRPQFAFENFPASETFTGRSAAIVGC